MHLVPVSEGAGQPPPAAAPAQAPAQPGRRQQPRQAAADTDAPICGRCGVNRVGKRSIGILVLPLVTNVEVDPPCLRQ